MRTILKQRLADKVSVKEMLQKCGWLSINQLAIFSNCIEAWKMIRYNTNCDILSDMTKNYTHKTRAASQNMFYPDDVNCSAFAKTRPDY